MLGESEVVLQSREFGWEFRDHSWVGQEGKDISLPRLLGRGRRRPDTGGGRGPSERQSMNAGRSLLGELVWRLWFNQSRVPALPTKACFHEAGPALLTNPTQPGPAPQHTPNPSETHFHHLPPVPPGPASRKLSLSRPHPSIHSSAHPSPSGSTVFSPFTVNLTSAAPPPRPESPASALHT